MMYERLSPADRNKIAKYINTYSGRTMKADLSCILNEWDNAKSDFLDDLLGGELIVSKPISYEQPIEEIEHSFRNSPKIYNFTNRMWDFIRRDIYLSVNPKLTPPFLELLEPKNIISNKVPDALDGLTFKDRKGKEVKLSVGMKVIKVLKKIAELNNNPAIMDLYEEFRLEHSRLLNQKIIKGELCLSIHPLDYMTMSDNDLNWRSCMSWKHSGAYRRGTVEMMNSPSVIVAYLKSNVDMKLFDDQTWNNKKWRCLFVATEDFMTSVKAYPYESKDLTIMCLDFIKELYSKNISKDHYWTDYIAHDGYIFKDFDGVKIDFDIGLEEYHDSMYCDFGSTVSYASFNLDTCENRAKKPWNNSCVIGYNYSGRGTCMCCGKPLSRYDFDEAEENESYLCCPKCLGLVRCDECGLWYDSRIMTTDDYGNYCPDCYEEFFRKNFLTEENQHIEDLTKVRVYTGNNYLTLFVELEQIEDTELWKDYITGAIVKEKLDHIWWDEEIYRIDFSELTELGQEKVYDYNCYVN